MKAKDYALIAVIFVTILALFKLKKLGILRKVFPTSVQSALSTSIDSVRIVDSFHVNAFNKSYRLEFEFPKHVRYYSSGDTSIVIYDTNGIKVRSAVLKNIDEPERTDLRQIITTKK
jgi:hypothetical protein